MCFGEKEESQEGRRGIWGVWVEKKGISAWISSLGGLNPGDKGTLGGVGRWDLGFGIWNLEFGSESSKS